MHTSAGTHIIVALKILYLFTTSATPTQSQTAATAYFKCDQLLLLVFELQNSLLPSSPGILTVVQRQTAVTSHLRCDQLLLFVLVLQDSLLPSSTGILTVVQRQTAVTSHFRCNQLLFFVSTRQRWASLCDRYGRLVINRPHPCSKVRRGFNSGCDMINSSDKKYFWVGCFPSTSAVGERISVNFLLNVLEAYTNRLENCDHNI